MFDLLNYFNQNEYIYVDEIDRIKESIFYGIVADGWYYMPAEKGSGDWNIARMIGDGKIAKHLVGLNTEKNLMLLVPQEFSYLYSEYKNISRLLYYVSTDYIAVVEPEVPYSIKFRKFQVFLVFKDTIIGYVKPIRQSANCLEVYIEIIPLFRGKGLSIVLLSSAVKIYSLFNKKLVYIVDEQNKPSLCAVKKAKFKEIAVLKTFEYP